LDCELRVWGSFCQTERRIRLLQKAVPKVVKPNATKITVHRPIELVPIV
jgi:hypothetical protein